MNGTAESPVRSTGREPAESAAAERRIHWLVFVVCVGMIAGALVIDPVASGERIRLGGLPVPEVCAFKAATGVPCPGCGLTRSWVAIAHGDLAGSVGFHPLGWLIVLYVVAQAARHGVWLALSAGRPVVDAAGRWLDRGVILLAVLLVVAWAPIAVEALSGPGA